MTDLIQRTIAMEWNMFDKIQNLGGRASCQENPTTFNIMRSSQFKAWTPELLQSYYQDLVSAKAFGQNLLSEKYAYMMERTNPKEYEAIKDKLPQRTPKAMEIIQTLCGIQVAWLEDLSQRYPFLTNRGRSIQQTQDQQTGTSFETYLWGELATYSPRTLNLYAAYVTQLHQTGCNLNEMVLQNTVEQYGYTSMDAAEQDLSEK